MRYLRTLFLMGLLLPGLGTATVLAEPVQVNTSAISYQGPDTNIQTSAISYQGPNTNIQVSSIVYIGPYEQAEENAPPKAPENLRVASKPEGMPIPEILPMPGQSLFIRVPVSLKIRCAPEAWDRLVFEFQQHDGRAWRAMGRPAFLVATKMEMLGKATVTQPMRFSAPGRYRCRCKVKGENAWSAWSQVLEIRDIGGGGGSRPGVAPALRPGAKPPAAGTRDKSPGQGLRQQNGPSRPTGRQTPGQGTSNTPTDPRSRLQRDTIRPLKSPSE